MAAILGQAKLGCQVRLCDFRSLALARETCRVIDKAQIADRINRLLLRVGGEDKTVNLGAGAAVGVSDEAVRQWRKAITLPRLTNLDPLCKFLAQKGIEATPAYILFGFLPKEVQTRELIANDGDELELLRLFRRSNEVGRERILEQAKMLQAAHPLDSKIVRFEARKRRRRS